jgi:hypothetical protein
MRTVFKTGMQVSLLQIGGLDTLVLIGDDILRNPTQRETDSVLRAYKKTDIDSVAIVAVSSDSAYTFPLSNYPSSLGRNQDRRR